MSIYCLRVLAGRRGARLTHPTDISRIWIRLMTMAEAKDRELRHFDAEAALLETSVVEEVYV